MQAKTILVGILSILAPAFVDAWLLAEIETESMLLNPLVTSTGATITATALMATPLVDRTGYAVQANLDYTYTDGLQPDLRLAYTNLNAYGLGEGEVLVLTIGDKTTKIHAKNSKIRKITINGKEVPAREVKALREINTHIEKTEVALVAILDVLEEPQYIDQFATVINVVNAYGSAVYAWEVA